MARTLTARVSRHVVDLDLTVDLETTPVTVVFGPSGAGKTTLLRCVAGLDRPEPGSHIALDGEVWDDGARHLPARRRNVGFLFQDHALFPHLDVDANVAYGLHRVPRGERAALTRAALRTAGAEHLSGRPTRHLSGGEAQRVALARTLAMNPRILLFDEPLSALDAQLKTRLRREIRDTQRALGVSSIYVTHDMEEAMAVADRLAVMEGGRILQIGPMRSLWSDPNSAAVARFLASGPCLPLRSLRPLEGGRLVATVDGGSVVLPAGSPAGAPADVRADSPIADGSMLFFPRGSVQLRDGSAGAPLTGGGAGGIRARCVAVEYLGDWAQCRMESGGRLMDLRFPAGFAPDEGEACTLHPEPSALRVIPERA